MERGQTVTAWWLLPESLFGQQSAIPRWKYHEFWLQISPSSSGPSKALAIILVFSGCRHELWNCSISRRFRKYNSRSTCLAAEMAWGGNSRCASVLRFENLPARTLYARIGNISLFQPGLRSHHRNKREYSDLRNYPWYRFFKRGFTHFTRIRGTVAFALKEETLKV